MKAKRYIISGQVQGVGFRWFARKHATLLSIQGWVRNKNDGSVEVWAEGSTQTLEEFENRLKTGPLGARVHSIQVGEVQPMGTFRGFDITY